METKENGGSGGTKECERAADAKAREDKRSPFQGEVTVLPPFPFCNKKNRKCMQVPFCHIMRLAVWLGFTCFFPPGHFPSYFYLFLFLFLFYFLLLFIFNIYIYIYIYIYISLKLVQILNIFKLFNIYIKIIIIIISFKKY